MATFNGEAFLEDQLASLSKQTRAPEELVICDDGSSDATVDILERFAKVAPFQVRIERNKGRLGHGKNFLKAASLCKGELVAFCDQDDVWLKNKLEASAKSFETPDAPSVAVHSAEVVDANLKSLGYEFPCNPVDSRVPAARCIPCKHWVGFALTFRRELLALVPALLFDEVLSVAPDIGHDHWVCFLAGMDRGFAFRREPLALYRQHAANTFGTDRDVMAKLAWARMRMIRDNEAGYQQHAASMELWADVIARARMQGTLRADEVQATRWETVHRDLVRRLRSRALIYRTGVPTSQRLRGLSNLIKDGAYVPNFEGGLGRRAVLKDAAVAAAGSLSRG